MATGFPAWIHNLPTPLPLDQVPRHIRLVGVSLNIHSGQVCPALSGSKFLKPKLQGYK